MRLSKKILLPSLIGLLFLITPLSLLSSNAENIANAQTCPSGTTLETGPFTNAPAGTSYACAQSPVVTGEGVTSPTIYDYYNSAGESIGINNGIATVSNGQVSSLGGEGNNCGYISWNFQNCIWLPLTQALGSMFLTFGAALLYLAGSVFDFLVEYFIIGFGAFIQGGLTTAINTAWSVFRDLANILIIGMLVFIAISIILGLHKFGDKKLIARVLIIAVLINFSLLFTKLIIDFSNFTAYQFYSASAGTFGATSCSSAASTGSTASGSGTGGTLVNGQTFDIVQAFLCPMGIESVFQTGVVVQNIATQTNSGWQVLLFGLVGMLFLAAVAAVLLYGSFLVAARGIMLIFLMVTASIAFATYLIPGISDGKYGWHTWWKSLINVSVFAPLLMAFLFVSLIIIQAAGKTTGAISNLVLNTGAAGGTAGTAAVSNTLSGFITNPHSSGTWGAIMIYIIGIGLLFAAIKVSSSFANSISGFNIAQMVIAAPAAIALGPVGSFALRNTVGAVATSRKESRISEAKEARTQAGDLRTSEAGFNAAAAKFKSRADRRDAQAAKLHEEANLQEYGRGDLAGAEQTRAKARQSEQTAEAARRRQAEETAKAAAAGAGAQNREDEAARALEKSRRPGYIADSRLNIMNATPAKAVAQMAGLPAKGFTSGQSSKETKSYVGAIEARAKAAAKAAEALNLSDTERANISSAANERFREQRRAGREQLEATRAIAEEVKNAVEQKAFQGSDEWKGAQSDKVALQDHQRQEIDQLEKAIANESEEGRKSELRKQLETTKVAHTNQMSAVNKRIEDARTAAMNKDQTVNVNGTELKLNLAQANKQLQEKENDISEYEKETREQAEKFAQDVVNNTSDSVAKAAGALARRNGDIITRAVGAVNGANDRAEKSAISKYRGSRRNARFKQVLQEAVNEDLDEPRGGGGGGSSPRPPSPPSGGGGTH